VVSISLPTIHGFSNQYPYSAARRPWTISVARRRSVGAFFVKPRSHGVGPPRLPLDHATALQHRRQGACEDSDVMRRGHPWPRLAARPMSSALGSHRRGTLEWYRLQASSTSARPPILDGRIRPISGARPKGTKKSKDARPRRSQRSSSLWCSERGRGAWRRSSQLPLGGPSPSAPQARGVHGLHRHVESPTVADAVIEACCWATPSIPESDPGCRPQRSRSAPAIVITRAACWEIARKTGSALLALPLLARLLGQHERR
jgi:hypothetical protein